MKSPGVLAMLGILLGWASGLSRPFHNFVGNVAVDRRKLASQDADSVKSYSRPGIFSVARFNHENGAQNRLMAEARPASKTPGGTPAQARPRHYNLTIWEPESPSSATFGGQVIMDLDIVEDTKEIFLHAYNLTFWEWSVKIFLENGTDVRYVRTNTAASPYIGIMEIKLQISRTNEVDSVGSDEIRMDYREGDQTGNLTLHLSIPIPAGSVAQINITYDGVIWPREDTFGLFENPLDPKNSTAGKYYATHSEENGARRIFPCLDDPYWKANFTVSMIVQKEHIAVSNMDVASETDISGGIKKKVTFHTSPPMPSYILALGMGDLEHRETTDRFRLPLRAYVPGWVAPELTEYPLAITAKGLAFFEDLLGIPVPLKKVDWWTIAGPRWGAMENWGMVVVGLENFAMDLQIFDLAQAQMNAWFFLHEIAHFWFGDLVTCNWWTEIWLNEGL